MTPTATDRRKWEELWLARLTGGEIVKHFNGLFSRGQIMGHLHRARLIGYRKPRPKAPNVKKYPRQPRETRKQPPAVWPVNVPIPSDAALRSFNDLSGPSYNILDLNRFECRWPIGNPGEPGFCFCSAPTSWGKSSYCPAHKAIAYESRTR